MKISAKLKNGLGGLSLALAGLLSHPAFADAPWEAGKRYALIVGIDDYQNESVTDLNCATSDARLLKETLVKAGDFSEDNIFLLSSAATGESDQPSLTNIVFRLEWLKEVVGPADTLVFYFAGHGVSMDSETFLLTMEADQRSKNTLMVSSLRGKTLNEMLKQTGAQNTLVLLDACRNDPTAGRGDVNNTLNASLARGLVFKPLPAAAPSLERNTATVFACSEGERSWEWGDKKQGFFTYYLAEGLRSGAYNAQGDATLQNLVGYLRDKVSAMAQRETNQKQTPMLTYEGPGADKWVLTRNLAISNPKEQIETQKLAAEVRSRQLAERARKDAEVRKAAEAVLGRAQAEYDQARAKLTQAEQGQGDLKTARAEHEYASDMLKLAQLSFDSSSDFVASTGRLQEESKTLADAAGLAERVATFGAAGSSPELESLKKELAELEGRLARMDAERKAAVERALKAEDLVASLELKLQEKWKGRMRGKRPTRRMQEDALIKIVTSDEEAEEAIEEDIPQ